MVIDLMKFLICLRAVLEFFLAMLIAPPQKITSFFVKFEISLFAVFTSMPAPAPGFTSPLNIIVSLYFGFNICCTKSGVTVTYNQHLMTLSVRRLTIRLLCKNSCAWVGLSFDCNWDSEVIFRIRAVQICIAEMSFANIFRHLTLTFHMALLTPLVLL